MILTGRNPGTLRKTCPTTTFSTKNPVWTGLESNRGSGSSILGLCGVTGGWNGAEERKKLSPNDKIFSCQYKADPLDLILVLYNLCFVLRSKVLFMRKT